MSYCSTEDIISQVGANNIIPFLDDEGSGVMNSTLLTQIISVADAAIDGRIANLYTVPVSPVVPILRYASIIFTCEMLYRRRLSPREENPYTAEADRLREYFKQVNTGEIHLDLNVPREFSQGVVNGRVTIYGGVWGSNSQGNSM